MGHADVRSPIGPPPVHAHHDHHMQDQSAHAHMVDDFRRRFWVSLALTVPVLATSEMIQHFLGLRGTFAFPGDRYVEFGFASAVYFYGGWPFLTGLVDELRKRLPGMMTLVALAITVAYVYSALVVFGLPGSVFFWETATLIDIMLLGHWIEMRSVLGASRALEQLVRLLPAEAHRLRTDGSLEDVALAALQPDDRVLVKPGEKVPTDGLVVAGRTSVNQAMLTGESQPVEKGEGNEVIGGAVNGEGAITIEVRRTGADTYVAQVIELVRKAQETRSRTQDLADRAALWLTLIAVGGGTLTLVAWLGAGREFSFALERMVTVMVITCPHALGLAVPLVVAVSTALSARQGLLIRDRSAFERARELDAVVFDKTGTLTEGRFGVTDIVSLDGRTEHEILRLAAALESRSEHPIAAGIVRAATERAVQHPAPDGFAAIPGKGARGIVDGAEVKVVSPGYLRDQGLGDRVRGHRAGALRSPRRAGDRGACPGHVSQDGAESVVGDGLQRGRDPARGRRAGARRHPALASGRCRAHVRIDRGSRGECPAAGARPARSHRCIIDAMKAGRRYPMLVRSLASAAALAVAAP